MFTQVASGTTIGATPKIIQFNPVTTTALRIFVVASNGAPSLAEFEIY